MSEKYFSEAERKQETEWFDDCRDFRFTFRRDLSNGITVKKIRYEVTLEQYSRACFGFFAWWFLNIYPRLNGFAGVDSIRWKFENFHLPKHQTI